MDLKPDKADACVARQIIVGPYCQTLGYELLFGDSDENACPAAAVTPHAGKLLSRTQLSLELEKLVSANTALINFPLHSLLNKAPTYFDADRIVVGIMNKTAPTPELVAACEDLKRLGYRLALDDFDLNQPWQHLHHLVDIIKIDVSVIDLPILTRRAATLKQRGKALLAARVEDAGLFHASKNMGFDYFQGYYFSRPEIIGGQASVSHSLAMLQLLADPH